MFQAIFQFKKSKSFRLFVVVFLCILARWKSCITATHRESSMLPIGRLGVIHDSQPHGYVLLYSHLD
jgi:hypothetical protein